jgi:hypothetical protein
MTDPKFGVGEAAARAPRLERGDFSNVVAVFRRYAADVRRQGEGDPACNQEAEAWQRAAEMLEHEQAARAPREPLEPELAPGIDILVSVNAALHAVNSAWRIDLQQGQAIAVPTPDVHSEFMAAARSALPPLQIQEEKEDARVGPSVPSRRTGSTASSNEPSPPFQSCHCPAAHGEDCPLTPDECDARTADYIGLPWFGERLRRVWDGFVRESMNGVVCSIPDTGLNTLPHRTWCLRCQRRYMELKALVEMLESRQAPDAVDPIGRSEGKPSTRDPVSSSSSSNQESAARAPEARPQP